ncbi:MAG: hypothetical protein KAX05_13435 [Bacteroidales bacterium]|nr:hypothetical protein [Bacteroidales bacterium]
MNNIELEKKVKYIANSLIYEKEYVCTVDILLRLDYLSKKDYEDWRFGRIEYLEKVCKVNLSKLSAVNRIIKTIARDSKLEKSWTGYNRYGKGIKRRLIFSKSGNKRIEDAYATHYLDKKRINELK